MRVLSRPRPNPGTRGSLWLRRGQGLVEFALVLPVLLLVIFAIFDFGRAFLIYTNLFNAAREGARYGMVHPWRPGEAASQVDSHVILVDPNDVDVSVCCDTAPGEESFYCNQVVTPTWGCGGGSGSWGSPPGKAYVGDRIVVSATYTVTLITPLVSGIVPELPIQTVAARTIATVGKDF